MTSAAAPEVAARPPQTSSTSTGRLRTDIQGLRAIAVSLVLVYHLFPTRLTGGFTGVDVFLVISGFLITSHLLNRPPTSGQHLLDFWARRIRRLLPASLLVLTVTLVASRVVAPETQWENTGRQVSAAALYVVNWLLAGDAVDYLAAENAPSPVQHFWSLSVEEQFYLGWPVLILVIGLAARRRGIRPTVAYGLGLGAVVALSLAWSIHLTATDPLAAYFVTPTRIWELGLGGLLAVWVVLRPLGTGSATPMSRAVLAWGGLGLIVWAGWTYSTATPFPSWRALLPVLGSVLVIGAACGTERWSPGRLLAVRPMQWLGDVSYSVYLWHWPLIVLLPAVSGHLGLLDKSAVLIATLLLAWATKVFVEDPFRTAAWNRRLGVTYLAGAVGMVLVLTLATVQVAEVDRRQQHAQGALQRVLAGDDPCLGAGSLAPGADCPPPTGDPVPAPAQAAEDKSEAYSDVSGGRDCWSYVPRYRTVTCEFGDPDAATEIVLVGNSHAGHWLPALQELAKQRGWRITTHLASRCAMSAVRQQFATRDHATACEEWVTRTTDRITSAAPDLVLISNRISVPAEGRDLAGSRALYREGYAEVVGAWIDAGIQVLALHDTPAPGDGGAISSIPECVAQNLEHVAACSGPRGEWLKADPVVDAVRDVDDDRAQVLDLNDWICRPRRCDGVVGGVIVYFDASHLTATYARTLAPHLGGQLSAVLAGS